jgi:Notch-like protein
LNIDNDLAEDKYKCRCKPGYEGKHCSIVTDMCLSHPCRNEAICHSLVNSYRCQCKPGYTGHDCQTNIDECSTLQPCENNATCVDGIADFSCICPSGFTGKFIH